MKICAKSENKKVATVYLAETKEGKLVEFVESVQPPIPREEKWVLIVSTLYGCPAGCLFCDAGDDYQGKISAENILAQIDYMIKLRFPDGVVPVPKFKIQFARMGEPSLNPAVLDVLEQLPGAYHAPGLLPAVSTIAPKGSEAFFRRLLKVKDAYYSAGFQLQFSIHTTDDKLRDKLIPLKKWPLEQISEYGIEFYGNKNRKITLNFALESASPVDADVLLKWFDPACFLIKLTPVNPTVQARKNGMISQINSDEEQHAVTGYLKKAGYDVIVSVGELEENAIGSNCGQMVSHYLKSKVSLNEAYTYQLKAVS